MQLSGVEFAGGEMVVVRKGSWKTSLQKPVFCLQKSLNPLCDKTPRYDTENKIHNTPCCLHRRRISTLGLQRERYNKVH